MELSKELLEKAESAKSAAELLEIAKAENIEMTVEQAEEVFLELHKSGELSDEELDNVVGGCQDTASPKGGVDREENVVFLYETGELVEYYTKFGCTNTALVLDRIRRFEDGKYYPYL